MIKRRRESVFLLTPPASADAATGDFKPEDLLALTDALRAASAANPDEASILVYLGAGPTWVSPDYTCLPRQKSCVWFKTFLDAESYQSAVFALQNVTFFHGAEGLTELSCYLHAVGAVDTGCQKDPFADDVFLRMQGEYLAQVETAIEGATNDEDTPISVKGEGLLSLVAGAAGTYELFHIAQVSTFEPPSDEGDAPWRRFVEFLTLATERDRDIYNRQVEARLPAAVELSVRQRVLVLCEDPKLRTQLKFALSHSRLEITFLSDPARLLDTLNRLQPDILVTEQSFRYFDGMDIAAHVHTLERFRALPILALLRDADEHTLTRVIRAGIDNHLTVPFSAANIALSVLNLLSRVETSRKLGGRDPLTGLYTKEALLDRLEQELPRTARSGKQIALMLLHLKQSETPRADFMALVESAGRVFRRSDVLARYNETTLAVMLPGIDGKTVLTITDRFNQMLGGRLHVETVVSLSDGKARAAALAADAEIRMTRALGGSRDAAMGLYEESSAPDAAAVPRILIADTDEAIINLLTFFCSREGFEVSDVRNGTDLLDRLEQGRIGDSLPDLLILESFLPGVDGFQVLERIQSELGGRVSVIMMSVRPSEDRVAKAFQLGAVDFVAKPFRVPEMIARIRNGLERTFTV